MKDNLETLREETSTNSVVQPESFFGARSVSKRENDSLEENSDTKEDEKMDRLIINNIKQTSKNEEKVLLKTEDTVKMAYTAFTCHDASSFETSIFELKSASCELSGVKSDKTSASSSKMEQLQKSFQNSRLYVGDASAMREIEQLQENMHNRNEYIGDTPPRREVEQFQGVGQSSIWNSNDTFPQQNIILNELSKIEKEIDSKSEVYSEEEKTDGYNQQVNTGKNIFSIGKQMVQNLIKWSFDDYEIASSTNYLRSLSKRLTK